MKKEIKIGCFFRGSKEHGAELIEAFEEAGAVNIQHFNGRDRTQIYYLTERRTIAATDSDVLQKLFEAQGAENEITIDDLREDDAQDMSCPQFPGIFKVVPCMDFTPLISPEDGEEYAYILSKEQMKMIDETLNELLS